MFFINANTGIIDHPDLISEIDYLCYLHEIGHLLNNDHKRHFNPYVDLNDVYIEINAWHYVYNCIKDVYIDILISLAVKCIQTYNSQSEINYGEYLMESEIINGIISGVKLFY